MTTLNNL